MQWEQIICLNTTAVEKFVICSVINESCLSHWNNQDQANPSSTLWNVIEFPLLLSYFQETAYEWICYPADIFCVLKQLKEI